MPTQNVNLPGHQADFIRQSVKTGRFQNAKRRPEIHEQARTFHIARQGHRARHFWLFRVTDDGMVEFGRLLHDSMELSTHLPLSYRLTDTNETD